MYKLVIQDDEGKTTVVPLIRDELTIGRKEGNTIRLTERNVSRAHARLTRSNGTVVIEDLNSYNGIRVNGSRIQGRATIAETDRVQIGDYLIEIRSAAAAEAGAVDETQPLERVTAPTGAQAETTQMPRPTDSATGLAPVPDVMALADTDPSRAAQVSNHGRLVVLSTNFPGTEFVLEKPSMVIGRTDENDVWLNHRSISRHHAKIVNENGRYSIEDLRSSNGVRVNGEEYGRVELRRADVIDLGHVRLRFVEPGEDFVFGRDAQPVDVTPEGGNKTWLWLAIAVAGMIGAIGIFVAVSGGGGEKGGEGGSGTGSAPGTSAGIDPGSGTGTSAVNTPPIDAAPEKPIDPDAAQAVEDGDAQKIKDLLARASTALKSGKHEQALSAAKQILELDEGHAEAKAIETKASAELRAASDLKLLRSLASAGKYDELKRKYTALLDTSASAAASQIYKSATSQEYKRLEPRVRLAAREGDCLDYRSRINKAKLGNNRSRLSSRFKCTPKGTGDGSGSGTGSGTGSGSDSGSASPAAVAKALRADVDTYGRAGNWGKTFKACDELIRMRKGSLTLYQKCTMFACRGGRAAKAKGYAARIKSAQTKAGLTSLCLQRGVRL